MLFVIDIGNTNICAGAYKDGALVSSLRIQTVPKKTEDEYSSIFRVILADRGLDPALFDRVLVSSVVPALSDAIAAMCRHLFRVEPMILGPELYARLPIAVPNPREIGADLVADALAAWKRTGGACVVVDFGTALTFTAVGRQKSIMGVAIAPGLGTAINALSRDTAQLPFVELSAPASVLGTDTVMAIQAGVIHGYVGLVEHMVGEIKKEIGGSVSVVATGGLCGLVSGLTNVFDIVDSQLTLDGLALAAWYGSQA